jgi:type VI protein secretion system component VasK
MKRVVMLLIVVITMATAATAQCSVCTKTAQQLGEKPAKDLNSGILYLAFMPFAIVGFITYKWWKNGQQSEKENPAPDKTQ